MGRAFLQYNHTLLLLFGSIAVVADDSQLPQRLRQLDAARAAFARTPDRPSAYLLARALLSYGHVRPSTVSNAFYVEAAETYRRAAALGGAAPSDASLLVDEAAAWVQDGNGARVRGARGRRGGARLRRRGSLRVPRRDGVAALGGARRRARPPGRPRRRGRGGRVPDVARRGRARARAQQGLPPRVPRAEAGRRARRRRRRAAVRR